MFAAMFFYHILYLSFREGQVPRSRKMSYNLIWTVYPDGHLEFDDIVVQGDSRGEVHFFWDAKRRDNGNSICWKASLCPGYEIL